MISVDEVPCEEKLVHNAPQQQPVHPKVHLEEGTKLAKSISTHIKPKKALPKSKYLEVKRAQIARNETNRKAMPKDRKNSQTKLGLQAVDQQIHSSVQAQRLLETLPQTTRNQSIGSKPAKQSLSRRATSNTVIGDNSKNTIQPQNRRPHLQKQLSSASNVTNEYFSVRPKMMNHCNLLSTNQQNDIIRSSSIEYDSHVTGHSDHSSIIISNAGQ